MTIAVIGAAAGIGLESVILGLERGHHMIAMSRDTGRLADHRMLTKINGNATNVRDLENVMVSADAVLITVGTKKKKGTTLFSEVAKAMIAAGKDLNYDKPVFIVTGFGAGDSKPYLNWFMKAVIRLFMKDQYADKTRMEDMIAGSNLNWGIVRPGILTNGLLTENYQVLRTLHPGIKVGKVSRINVASYLISEAENPVNLGLKITVT